MDVNLLNLRKTLVYVSKQKFFAFLLTFAADNLLFSYFVITRCEACGC